MWDHLAKKTRHLRSAYEIVCFSSLSRTVIQNHLSSQEVPWRVFSVQIVPTAATWSPHLDVWLRNLCGSYLQCSVRWLWRSRPHPSLGMLWLCYEAASHCHHCSADSLLCCSRSTTVKSLTDELAECSTSFCLFICHIQLCPPMTFTLFPFLTFLLSWRPAFITLSHLWVSIVCVCVRACYFMPCGSMRPVFFCFQIFSMSKSYFDARALLKPSNTSCLSFYSHTELRSEKVLNLTFRRLCSRFPFFSH